MGNRRVPFESGEVYHIYNRGAHKSDIFRNAGDYERFQVLLLLCNQSSPVHLENLLTKYKGPSFIKMFLNEVPVQSEKLVEILAYSLMPNHFHLILKERMDGGITRFMRKMCTAYSMAHNAKHGHSGTLFQGRFKSNHVDSDRYFNWLVQYVHLNAVDLVEKKWKEVGISNKTQVTNFLKEYKWSSFFDYANEHRPEKNILSFSKEIQKINTLETHSFLREYENYKGPSFIV